MAYTVEKEPSNDDDGAGNERRRKPECEKLSLTYIDSRFGPNRKKNKRKICTRVGRIQGIRLTKYESDTVLWQDIDISKDLYTRIVEKPYIISDYDGLSFARFEFLHALNINFTEPEELFEKLLQMRDVPINIDVICNMVGVVDYKIVGLNEEQKGGDQRG